VDGGRRRRASSQARALQSALRDWGRELGLKGKALSIREPLGCLLTVLCPNLSRRVRLRKTLF
jgi:hypothetical protein